MRSAVERRRDYRKIVSVSIAASAVLHAAVLGLGRVHVEVAGDAPSPERDTRVVASQDALQVVVLEPAPAEQAPPAEARDRAAPAPAAVGPAEAAPSESFATAASDAAEADAAPSEPAAVELRRPAPARSLPLDLATPGRVVAAEDVHATVPDAPVGGSEDEEDEDGGGGLKGIIDGIGGFLGGIKVSGGIGGGGGSGGKGGCEPGIGGITGGRRGGHSIPQRPAVGAPGIGGRGPIRFQHRSGPGSGDGGCRESR